MKRLTCRHCGQALQPRRSQFSWMSGWYSSIPESGPQSEVSQERQGSDPLAKCSDGSWHSPKELCDYPKNEGGNCSNPVKHEDLESSNYACGIHMKRFLEDVEREKRRRQLEKERKELKEMRAWELGIYQEAYDRLTAIDQDLFSADDRPKGDSWNGRFNKNVTVDIVTLERWMRSYAEDTAAADS